MAASPQLATSEVVGTGRFHRPELDVLRFGAFFLVFLNHAMSHASADYVAAGVPSAGARALAMGARAGALGVDLFFALSAYLITELLLRERRARGTVDIRSFYVRRILRIWPLYFFALLVLAPLLGRVLPGEGMPAAYTGSFLLLAGNWACAGWGYPASAFALLWSVSIEEQFYLSWPWLMRRYARHAGRLLVGMLVVASVTRVVLAARGVEHPGVWCNTLARLDPIAGGALLAYWLDGRLPVLATWRRVVLVVGGAMGLGAAGGVAGYSGWSSVATYPVAAAGCIVILFGTLGVGGSGVGARVLGYLGKISYGLYVLHAAVLRVVESWVGDRLVMGVVGLGVTVAAAAVSYRFLEAPFLRWKERFAHVGSRTV